MDNVQSLIINVFIGIKTVVIYFGSRVIYFGSLPVKHSILQGKFPYRSNSSLQNVTYISLFKDI